MDSSSIPWAFCLQTSRLDDNSLQTSRQCSLTLHVLSTTNKVHLQLSNCVFMNEDEYSTIITGKFPNIFIDQIFNKTFALGRIFQEIKSNDDLQVHQWNIINIQVCIQSFSSRCFLLSRKLNKY
jgi:hypothetical protein